MTQKLVLDPLQNAIQSLKTALLSYKNDNAEFTRDACIKRFEYTYELCHKMLKRHLEITSPTPSEIDEYTFQTLIRTGYERGLLLNSWDKWATYRDNRNRTSHGYNEQNAIIIVGELDDFMTEATHLLNTLKNHHPTP